MTANQPQWPREWLMTDERIGERLREAIDRLPVGSGVVFRHYSMAREERAELAAFVAGRCRDRGLILSIASDVELALSLDAALVHNPSDDPVRLPMSRSAHSLAEARDACDAGATLLFVAPVYPTRSHPGRPNLGHERAVEIARSCPIPSIALGGVDRANFAPLQRDGFYGWAGIDAWLGEIRT